MHFKKILFIGAGLIGGSIIKTLRQQNQPVRLEAAVRRKAQFSELEKDLDQVFLIEDLTVSDWDMIIVTTPVQTIAELVKKVLPLCSESVLITDVGSTKNTIAEALKTVPQFIGSHPMAGAEKGGYLQAKGDLFQDRTVVICPTSINHQTQVNRLALFWESLGARIVIKTPEEHDQIVAYTSHLPHVISFLFSKLGKDLNFDLNSIFGNSFLDLTRIASSDAGIWLPIFQSNKKNLVDFMEKFIKFLCDFTQSIEKNDWEAIESIIVQSNHFIEELKRKK